MAVPGTRAPSSLPPAAPDERPFALGDRTQLSFDAAQGTLANLHAFVLFTAATSLGWDVGRAITTVGLVLLAGPAVLAALRRASRRAAFDAPVEFAAAPR